MATFRATSQIVLPNDLHSVKEMNSVLSGMTSGGKGIEILSSLLMRKDAKEADVS